MPLLTTPVVLNDGTVNRTFSFRSQLPSDKKNTIAGEYVEDAATIAANSVIVIKHDKSAAVSRHLLQRTENVVPAANPTLGAKQITVNFTVMADDSFSTAEVNKQVLLLLDALDEANVVDSLLKGRL